MYETGVMITGGGTLLRGLDRIIADETKLKVHKADDPLRSVAMGSGKVLDQFELLKKVCVTWQQRSWRVHLVYYPPDLFYLNIRILSQAYSSATSTRTMKAASSALPKS